MSKKLEKITCPQCGKSGTWVPKNKFKPFCSERCKLIDLGEWASESYTIPDSEPGRPFGPDSEENKK